MIRRWLMFEVMVFLLPSSAFVFAFGLPACLVGGLIEVEFGHALDGAYSLVLFAAEGYGLVALWILSLAYMDRTRWPQHVWGGWKYGIYAGIVASVSASVSPLESLREMIAYRMMMFQPPTDSLATLPAVPSNLWVVLALIWLAPIIPAIHALYLDWQRTSNLNRP